MIDPSKSLSPLKVGNNVLIRTITMIQTGRIVELNDLEVVLSDAAWIADTGRFHNALVHGTLNEIEPFPGPEPISVNRGSIIDVVLWKHPLPREQK